VSGPDASALRYAEIYAQRGDKAAALHWLARAEAARDPELTGLRIDLLLDPIRGTPELKALEKRLNFPPCRRPIRRVEMAALWDSAACVGLAAFW
jgi:hypothetical protein